MCEKGKDLSFLNNMSSTGYVMLVISHNFQSGATQEISDMVLGTTGIVRSASNLAGESILFCGVIYMAEDLYIMSDGKARVFIPEIGVRNGNVIRPRCPMISKQKGSEIITMKHVEMAKKENADTIMAYINTPASIKAEVDGVYNGTVGLKVIEEIAHKNNGQGKVAFIGDHNVNEWIFYEIKDKYPEFEVVSIPKDNVECPTHVSMPQDLFAETYEYLVKEFGEENVGLEMHPEVDANLRSFGMSKGAYFGGSGGLVAKPKESKKKVWLVGTEEGVVDRLRRETQLDIFSLGMKCPNMAFTSPKKVNYAREILEDEGPVAEIVYKFKNEPYYEIKILNDEYVRIKNQTKYIPAVKLKVSDEILVQAKKSLSTLL
jgi:quinolinate synthase